MEFLGSASSPGSGTPTGIVTFTIGSTVLGIATLSGGSGTPAGSVTFRNGTTTLGTVTLSGGSASLSTAKLAMGQATITATYNGNASFITSTASVTQAVNQDGTTTTVTSSPSTSVYGQSVTFSFTVSATAPGGGTPTGSITLTYGSTTPETASLSGGKATIKTNALPAGTDLVTATYLGDTNFLTSMGTLTQIVNQDSTTTKLTSSANPSVYGQAVTFTVTVSAASPGSGAPTGMVTFYDGTTDLGTGTLSNDTTSITISMLAVGSNAITAVYGGDSNFMQSTSASLNQNVKQASTTTSVVSSLSPSVAGQAVTFTATTSLVSPGSGTPTGTATFMDASTTLGTAALDGGIASFITSALAVGTHSIKVVYSGDANFKASTSAVLSQVVQSSAEVIVAGGTSEVVDPAIGIVSTSDVPTDSTLLHDAALEQVTIGSRRTRRFAEL